MAGPSEQALTTDNPLVTYAIYNRDTGSLLDLSNVIVDVALPIVCQKIAAPDLSRETWSTTLRVFVPKLSDERNISGVAYLRRFTQAERIAIRGAATHSPELDDYLKLLDATIAQGGIVDLNDDDTILAVNMLEQFGLITLGRAAEILA